MAKKLRRWRTVIKMVKIGLGGMMLAGMLMHPVHAEEVFDLILDS